MSLAWVAGALAILLGINGVMVRMIMVQRGDLTKVAADLSNYKEKVAEEYASKIYLDKIEQRIIKELCSLGTRLEKHINSKKAG